MKLHPNTIKMLRRIQKEIKREPRRFIMEDFFDSEDEEAPCKSAACIAGFTLILRDRDRWLERVSTRKTKGRYQFMSAVKRLEEEYKPIDKDTAYDAARVLRLDSDQERRLFFSAHWPQKFYTKYLISKNNRSARARIAVQRIEHFIKTGGD